MSKYKIGDRVRVAEDWSRVPVGSVGTVSEECLIPYVIWDDGTLRPVHEAALVLEDAP